MQKKSFLTCLLILALCFCFSGDAGAKGGSAADPLVSKSWVDAYVAERFSSLEGRIDQLQQRVNNNKAVSLTLTIGSSMAEVDRSFSPIDAENPLVMPYIDNSGRTLVPVRFIGESLGASVQWDAASRTVSVQQGSTTIQMTVGQKEYTINGQLRSMDTAPVINSGWNRTMVPVRFVAEALGCTVDWAPKDAAVKYVYISR